MIYLMSAEVGWDQQGIGFPSVMTCIAIVYATQSELIGWHTFNTLDETTIANSEALGRYVLAKRHSNPVHLYAASSSAERGKDWDQLTVRIARRLGYEGPVTVVDTHLLGGTYFEFTRAQGGANIRYKKNAKMNYPTMTVDPHQTRHRRIIRSPNSGLPHYKSLYGGNNNQAVIFTQPVVTSNSGLLRAPSQAMLRTFRVEHSWGKIRRV